MCWKNAGYEFTETGQRSTLVVRNDRKLFLECETKNPKLLELRLLLWGNKNWAVKRHVALSYKNACSTERCSHFRGKKCSKMYLKINRSWKRRDVELVWEFSLRFMGSWQCQRVHKFKLQCEEAIQQISFHKYRLHRFNTQQRTRGSRRLVVFDK